MSKLLWLVPIWFVMALTWALWLLWPSRRRGILPRQRRRAVPWGGPEVFVALFLALLFWPSVLDYGLRRSGSLGRLYGPLVQAQLDPAGPRVLETTHLVAQAFASQATAPAGAPAGALAQQLAAFGVAEGRAFTLPANSVNTRITLFLTDLALPLNLLSIPILFYLVSGTRPYQLGLTAHRFVWNVLLGVVATVCVVPLVYLILAAVNWLQQQLIEVAPEEHPITRLVHGHPTTIDLVVSGLAALLAGPLLEEFLFRGIIQPWFRVNRWAGFLGLAGALFLALARRWSGFQSAWAEHGLQGAWHELLPAAFVLVMVPGYLLVRARAPAAAGAVYATSLLFAAAHSFAWPSPVPLFFFALALGAMKYRTQSLVPSVVTHALFNSVGWVILLLGQPADKLEKGKEVTDARARVECVSTSSAVPGSVLPRRT